MKKKKLWKHKNCEACRALWDRKVLLKFLFGMLLMGTLLSYSGLLTVLVNKGEHSKACSEAYLSFFFFLIFLLIFFLLSKWKPTILAECFAESAYLEPKWGKLCLQQVTSPCWMEAHPVKSGAGSKTSVKEPAWLGAVHSSEVSWRHNFTWFLWGKSCTPARFNELKL